MENKAEKKDKLYSRIFFWSSVIISTLICYWHYTAHPPDKGATKKMRLFMAANARDISHFLRLSLAEQRRYADKNRHPFYKKFVQASEVEKANIRTLAHNSLDYKPTQYWVNLVFLWAIFFSTLWFLGLMTQAVIQIIRRDKSKRP
ncbi:MAG: hypothetical protein ACE5G9_03840 [Nitrospinales bacterium]